jgi:hypothetical protein
MMALGLAAVLLVGGRRLFDRVPGPASVEDPSYLSRLSVAFWSTLLPTLAVGVYLGSTVFFFNYYNVLRGDIGVSSMRWRPSSQRCSASSTDQCGAIATTAGQRPVRETGRRADSCG